jgi:pimeloyl-ACP methyl ester carboxylesterase
VSSANLLDVGLYAAGEKSLRVVPKYYRPNNTRTGVIFAHGHGGDALQARDGANAPGLNAIIEAIGENGNPVLSCDFAGNSWGNATASARMNDAYALLQGSMGAKAGKVIVIGYSMGHVVVANWAAANPTKVAGIVGLLPVCDMADIYAQSNYVGSINTAYGGSYNNATLGGTNNPLVMANAGKFATIPWKGYSIADDTIATYSKVQAMATAVGANGSIVTLAGSGGHGNATLAKVDPASVVSFIKGIE